MKIHRSDLASEDPQKVCDPIKDRLLQFKETQPEKQARILREFEVLMKNNMTALQWEHVFEKALAELPSVGLPLGREVRVHQVLGGSQPKDG